MSTHQLSTGYMMRETSPLISYLHVAKSKGTAPARSALRSHLHSMPLAARVASVALLRNTARRRRRHRVRISHTLHHLPCWASCCSKRSAAVGAEWLVPAQYVLLSGFSGALAGSLMLVYVVLCT